MNVSTGSMVPTDYFFRRHINRWLRLRAYNYILVSLGQGVKTQLK